MRRRDALRPLFGFLLTCMLAFGLSACPSDVDTETICVQGEVCVCGGGGRGSQECPDDGRPGFCLCDLADASDTGAVDLQFDTAQDDTNAPDLGDQDSGVRDSASAEDVPEDQVTDDADRGEMSGEDVGVDATDDAASDSAGGQDTTVQDTTVQDTTVQDTTVQDTTVQDTTVQDATVDDTMVEDTGYMIDLVGCDVPMRGDACGACGSGILACWGPADLMCVSPTTSCTTTRADQWTGASTPFRVLLAGNYVYMSNGGSGIARINITDPDEVLSAGTYPTSDARGMAVSGDYGFIADGEGGLIIVDVSDPASITYVSEVALTSYSMNVVVVGDYAYVANYGDGLTVVGISNIEEPSFVRSLKRMGARNAQGGLAVNGDYIYVGDDNGYLEVYSLETPESAAESITSVTIPSSGYEIVVQGDYAYVACGSGGMAVFDVSTPQFPDNRVLCSAYETVFSVAVSGDLAVIADRSGGLQVVDVSTPLEPKYLGSYELDDWGRGIAFDGVHAYVGELATGLTVVDLSMCTP